PCVHPIPQLVGTTLGVDKPSERRQTLAFALASGGGELLPAPQLSWIEEGGIVHFAAPLVVSPTKNGAAAARERSEYCSQTENWMAR
ncbi:hypothetical protein AB4144_55820, partial [Rhizobiaceae sp. 2RAB30]